MTSPPALDTVEMRIARFREAKRKGLIPHRRARSKQDRDTTRRLLREERARLYHEAYHDQLESVGEVDARSSSMALDIQPGEVLRDPKVRGEGEGYQHPSLRKFFREGFAERMAMTRQALPVEERQRNSVGTKVDGQ